MIDRDDGKKVGVIKFGGDVVKWKDHGKEELIPVRNLDTGNVTHKKRGRYTAFNMTTGTEQPMDSMLLDAIMEDERRQEEKA